MPKFPVPALEEFAASTFVAAGSPADIAREVSRSLLLADLSGHPSHGILRVPSYIEAVQGGRIDPKARPGVVRATPNMALIDGRWAFGQLSAAEATRKVAAMAKESSIAMVAVISCNHVGRLGEWAELAAEKGVILIMAVGGPTGYLGAPFGGAGRALSTNPMSAAIPAGARDALILDFATTSLAEGKMKVARAKRAPAPAGTIVDKHGRPTTDVEEFYDGGMLLPFGGHKGYALSLVVEALASCLTGSDATEKPSKFGALLIGIDPTSFRPAGDYGASVDRLFDRMTAVPPAPGFSEVLIPGDPERRSRARLRAEGVELAPATVQALVESAGKLGVDAGVLQGGA